MHTSTEQPHTYRLTIELVPSTCWFSNMRTKFPKRVWDAIRKEVYARYQHRCGICQDGSGRMNCHEIWHYDDETHVQRLDGFIALCDLCHHVKHIGLASILASKGQLDYEAVIHHFMRVNACSREDFERYREQAFQQWSERSAHQDQIVESEKKEGSTQ